MFAASRPQRLAVATGFATAAAALGLLAGLDPRFAIAAALSAIFLLVVISDLYAGLVLFTLLSFLAVIPNFAGPAVSAIKLAGLLLALSWIATLAARRDSKADFLSAHPVVTFVLVAFLGWIAISQLWAEDSAETLSALWRLSLNAILFLIIFTAVRTRAQAMGVIGAFVAGASIQAVYGLLFVTPEGTESAARLASSIANPNELAAALVAALALAIGLAAARRDSPPWRVRALMAAALCTGGVFLTGSRAGLVALGVALVAFMVIGGRSRGRFMFVAIAVVALGIGYYGYVASPEARERVATVGDGTGRLDLWAVAWRIVEDKPLVGVGGGNFEVTSAHYLLEPGAIERDEFIIGQPKVAHNTYLEILAELGVVGLFLFASILAFGLFASARAAREFRRQGDNAMELIAGALFVALAAVLAADFFGSRHNEKELWLLLGLAPALLAIARRQANASDA